jgi:phage repressor protein C with HTH and peptisase S24 domain
MPSTKADAQTSILVYMGSIGSRLRQARLDANETLQALADAAGVSRQAVSQIERDRTKQPEAATLEPISRKLEISLHWLMTGKGQMRPVASSTGSPTDTALSVHNPESSREIAPGYVRLGLLDVVPGMGDSTEIVEFPEVIREMDFSEVQLRNLIGFLPRVGRLQLMTGRGTSMEPVIKPGDVVIVDTGCQHFDGDAIYVINAGRGVQIKALQDRGDGLWVVSANATYPPFKADDDLIIVGKVYVRNRLERLD